MVRYRWRLLVLAICCILAQTKAHHRRSCVQRVNKITPRIIGGKDIRNRATATYLVSVQVDREHICGGSILTERWVITAAHCVEDRHFQMIAGIIDLQDNDHEQVYEPLEVVVHCNFGYPSHSNDIALVRTTQSIYLGRFVKYIELAIETVPIDTQMEFVGWGATKYGKSSTERVFPNLLQLLHLSFVSHNRCKNVSQIRGLIDPRHICALAEKGKGACKGDSGGALVHNGRLMGVASSVLMCAKGHGDVFASVPYYYDFIRTTISSCDTFIDPTFSKKNQCSEFHRKSKNKHHH